MILPPMILPTSHGRLVWTQNWLRFAVFPPAGFLARGRVANSNSKLASFCIPPPTPITERRSSGSQAGFASQNRYLLILLTKSPSMPAREEQDKVSLAGPKVDTKYTT